jgi:hypothetical protein
VGVGGVVPACLTYFLFAIIIIISDEIFQLSHVIFIIQFLSRNTKCESSFFADACTRRVPIFLHFPGARYHTGKRERWIRACHRGDKFVYTKDSYIFV